MKTVMIIKKSLSYSWWIFKVAVVILLVLLFCRAMWNAVNLTSQKARYYNYIRDHLSEKKFEGYSTAQVLRQDPFQIVALSNMAMGFMSLSQSGEVSRQELLPLIDEVKRRAISEYVSPFEQLTPETDFTTGGVHGLYLSHLNLILSIHQYLHQAELPDPLHKRITEVLAQQSSADNHFHVSSFADGSQWPADQAVTLLSLYVYDQANKTNYSAQPIEDWLQFIKTEMRDSETGLTKSALADRWYKDIPRGSALSWMILYMAQFAPSEAHELYSQYREVMWKEWGGVGGFREWPAGRPGHMNRDTGPIIFDVGSSATALGLGPTKLMGDAHRNAVITRLFSFLGVPYFSPLIGITILFNAETTTLWFTDFKPPGFTEQPESLFLALFIYFVIATAICLLVLFGDVVILRMVKYFLRKKS